MGKVIDLDQYRKDKTNSLLEEIQRLMVESRQLMDEAVEEVDFEKATRARIMLDTAYNLNKKIRAKIA